MNPYLHPKPKTFQEAARHILCVLELDGKWRDIDKPFDMLFDERNYGAIAAKAAHLLDWHIQDDLNPNRADKAIEAMVAILASKQHDYGPGNILKFGHDGILVRLYDKIARYDNLVTKRGVGPMNESVADTLWDMIGYVVLDKMLLKGFFELPLGRF